MRTLIHNEHGMSFSENWYPMFLYVLFYSLLIQCGFAVIQSIFLLGMHACFFFAFGYIFPVCVCVYVLVIIFFSRSDLHIKWVENFIFLFFVASTTKAPEWKEFRTEFKCIGIKWVSVS